MKYYDNDVIFKFEKTIQALAEVVVVAPMENTAEGQIPIQSNMYASLWKPLKVKAV